ncbi:L-threonylcarbamoyladenylate synthase [Bacillus sp. FJAT-50079]|uniref:L-threonylcarbamoyladenylate synthase n=1 Tax=Bacillus sp. FJAT-50079 TaxID=2833577 RepID=UPI001BC9BEC5|nr:L-threonylcarbamoyladenylate synthase [Bacillus sp. FJAT-50079]MBS4206804.1 threonylcarbamoyl-AMP synthase [Bacillus sp. FJAT-50079]
METIYWTVDKGEDNLSTYPQIIEAAERLRENEVVAFPTETVYGLGANARSDEAIKKIYTAKGRPSDNPLIVHISTTAQLEELTESIPPTAKQLMKAFWPGPLTIIFQKKKDSVSELVTAGLDTVAVRMPDHPVALALLTACGLPIAAPSANVSGKPSPTIAEHVKHDLDGKIAGIVDGGATGVGVESTVIDCTQHIPVILRPGGVSIEEMEAVVDKVTIDRALVDKEEKPKSPGMKYTHYAPAAPLYLVDGERKWIQQLIDQKRKEGLKVAILATEESASTYTADFIATCGSRKEIETIAQQLFQTLRTFDEKHPDLIFAEVFPRIGIGAAVMNRLEKAAGYKWLKQDRK